MNELIFLCHSLFLVGSILVAVRIGKAALSLIIALFFIIANLFVTKQITLFGYMVTAADAYAIGGIFALNILQEFYGKKAASKQIILNTLAQLLFVSVSMIHLAYIPSEHDTAHPGFMSILSQTPRIFFVSLFVFFLVQKLDVEFFSVLRKRLFPKSLGASIAFSLLVSQFIDTVLFSFLALYGIVHNITHIIFVSFLIKAFALCLMVPFANFTKKIHQRTA